MWGGMDNDSKLDLVNWKKVCTPIQLRGLGIMSLTTFNQALLEKWLWGFVVERKAFWHQIVDTYVSLAGGWCTKGVTGPYGVSL